MFATVFFSLLSQLVIADGYGSFKDRNSLMANLQIIPSKVSENIYKVTDNIPDKIKSGHAFVQLGGYWSNQGSAQHININTLIGDDFIVAKSNGSNGLVGFGFLVDGPQYNDYIKFLYGVNAFYLPKTTIGGNVVQESLFTNLSYTYKVTHWPLYALVKAVVTPKAFQHELTVDIGIGPNFMRLTDFKEQPILPNAVPDTIFSNNTSTTFTVTLGAGIKLDKIFTNIPLECGYRFYYLGNGSLKINNSQVQNALDTGSAYANALMCSLTT